MKKYLTFIVALCLLMTSCQSVRVEYKYIVPDIKYPEFPLLEREVHKDGSWTITKESVEKKTEPELKLKKSKLA